MKQNYGALEQTYNNLVREIVPTLTAENVDQAVDAINTLVKIHRPDDWQMDSTPQQLLAITFDRQRVVYQESSRLGLYRAVAYDQLFQSISESVKTEERHGLQSAKKMLEALVTL